MKKRRQYQQQRLFIVLTQVFILLHTMKCCCSFVTPTIQKNRAGYQTVGNVENGIPTATTTQLFEQQQQQKEETSVGKEILNLSIPTLGALLIDPLLTLIDTAFVGRFAESSNELAGMGSAAALLTFSFYLCNFLCTATTPLVSNQRASGKEDQAIQVGGQALSLALVLGLLLVVILLSLQQPLLNIMMGTSSTEAQQNFAHQFLSFRAIAAPAVLTISASTGILRGYLDTKTPIVILVVANLVNLALDVVLIGFLKMGPMGAAIATTTAEWMSAILFLGVLSGMLPSAEGELGKKPEGETTKSILPARSIPSWQEFKPLLVASSSLFLRTFVLQLYLSSAAALAARDGEADSAAASMSAHQIGVQLWILGSFISDALAAASQALVADGMGRKDSLRIRTVSQTVLIYSMILGIILALLLSLGTDGVLQLFTTDVDTQQALKEIIPLIILAQPLNAYVFAADGILQGASEFPFQAKSMALSGAVGAVSFLAINSNDSSSSMLVHVWTALLVLQLVRGITSTVKMVDTNGPIQIWKSLEK